MNLCQSSVGFEWQSRRPSMQPFPAWKRAHWMRMVISVAPLWINGVISLQEVAVEDFEYYAIYESGFLDLAWSFATFKPFEVLIVVATSMMVSKGRSLLYRNVEG